MSLTSKDLQSIAELMDRKFEPMRGDINELKADMAEVKNRVTNIETHVTNIETHVTNIETRVTNIETRVTKIEITQENVIVPKIQLLYEGHSSLLGKLDPLEDVPEKVEDIQNSVSVLKYVFKDHSHK